MTKSKYDSQIRGLEEQKTELSIRLGELRRLRAKELCEFSVGDEVINKHGATGKVISIEVDYSDGNPLIKLHKKDGTLGRRSTKGYSWEKWNLTN